jgi:cytosine/adenosine deaminase-related metal-dependent hydrolase
MKYLIGNATVVTVDQERRIITEGAVATENDRIVDIGKTEALKSRYPDFEFIDAGHHIIMPGLVNAHVHLTQALIKGCADDVELMDFLQFRVWKLMGNYSPQEAAISTELCALEMIKSGTTTFAETLLARHYGLDELTRIIIASGMRGILAKSVMDLPSYASRDNIMDPGMIEEGEECLRIAGEWKDKSENAGDGRIQIWLGPRPVGSITEKMLGKVAEMARRKEMGIAIHFCEVREDVNLIRKTYNMEPGEFMEKVGILTGRTLLAHAIWLSQDDMNRIGKNKSTVVHCPASNAKLASGICPVPELLQSGVNVALGTDAGTCDNGYDMFDAMKLAAIMNKARTLSPVAVPAETCVEMATINGAKALGMEKEIGSLEIGKKADLILINCNNARIAPNINPISSIVYSVNGSDVDNVMIDGQWIVRKNIITTMDEEKIIHNARKAIYNILARTSVSNKPGWPVF